MPALIIFLYIFCLYSLQNFFFHRSFEYIIYIDYEFTFDSIACNKTLSTISLVGSQKPG